MPDDDDKESVEGMKNKSDAYFGEPDIHLSDSDQEAMWEDYLDWCRRNENAQHE